FVGEGITALHVVEIAGRSDAAPSFLADRPRGPLRRGGAGFAEGGYCRAGRAEPEQVSSSVRMLAHWGWMSSLVKIRTWLQARRKGAGGTILPAEVVSGFPKADFGNLLVPCVSLSFSSSLPCWS